MSKRKCKCKICKSELLIDEAYKITNEKGKNQYYCSEKEYNDSLQEKQDKEKSVGLLCELLKTPYAPPYMSKKLNIINKHYNWIVIFKTINAVADRIKFAIENKEFTNDSKMINYVFAIIENNIMTIYKKHTEEQKQLKKLFEQPSNDVDLDILNDIDIGINVDNKSKTNNDISEWLD